MLHLLSLRHKLLSSSRQPPEYLACGVPIARLPRRATSKAFQMTAAGCEFCSARLRVDQFENRRISQGTFAKKGSPGFPPGLSLNLRGLVVLERLQVFQLVLRGAHDCM